MHLVTIAWLYVVLMMALAEAFSPQGTVLGAVFTFLLYGVLPLSLVLYLLGTPMRRRARMKADAAAMAAAKSIEGATEGATEEATERASELEAQAPMAAGAESTSTAAPDGRGHAAGDTVAAERKET